MTLRPKPEQERPLHEMLQVFDLEQAQEQLRAEPTYATGRDAITLWKAPHLRVVLLTQQAGNVLDDHQAAGSITIHVLHGRIRFVTPDQTVDLHSGMLLALDGGIVHRVEALDNSVSLLTLAKQ